MSNPLDKLVLVGTISPYLPTSFLGRQEPSPFASLRGTKQGVLNRSPQCAAVDFAQVGEG